MCTQASLSSFQTEISPCLPKFNPDPECEFSPLASTPRLAGGHFWKMPGKAAARNIATKFYLINCHSGKDWGAKLWPDMLAFIRLKKKRNNQPDFRS